MAIGLASSSHLMNFEAFVADVPWYEPRTKTTGALWSRLFVAASFITWTVGENPSIEDSEARCWATASQVPVSEPYRILIGRPSCAPGPVGEACFFNFVTLDGFCSFSARRLLWNAVAFRPCLSLALILNPSGLIVRRCLIFSLYEGSSLLRSKFCRIIARALGISKQCAPS